MKLHEIINFNRLVAALRFNGLLLAVFFMALISLYLGSKAMAFTLMVFMSVTVSKVIETYYDAYELTSPSVAGFRSYQGKPVVRVAYEITEADTIVKTDDASTSEICVAGTWYKFKHYVEVKAGDYVVFLNEKDIYHCERAVFLERNEV